MKWYVFNCSVLVQLASFIVQECASISCSCISAAIIYDRERYNLTSRCPTATDRVTACCRTVPAKSATQDESTTAAAAAVQRRRARSTATSTTTTTTTAADRQRTSTATKPDSTSQTAAKRATRKVCALSGSLRTVYFIANSHRPTQPNSTVKLK